MSIFGCQLMRVTLEKNELYNSSPSLVTPTFKLILHPNVGTHDVIAMKSCTKVHAIKREMY